MPGLFERVKNWIGLETVRPADLNKEFNNIIHHYTPQYMDDVSSSIGQMQQTLNPGTVGTEAPASSLADEIQQIRYMLKAISGGAQWYSPPVSNIAELATLYSAPNHRLVSGRVDAYKQPMWLIPNGSAATVSLAAAATDLVTYINGALVTFDSDISKTSLTVAPSSNNTAAVNQLGLAGQQFSKFLGEGDSVIPIDTVGSEITALNGTRAAFKVVHGGNTEYFVADVDTTNGVLRNAYRGYFFNSSDANVGRIAIHDNDTITLMKLTWAFATYVSSVQGLDVTYRQPSVSYDTPGSPSSGDYWFDLSTNLWKKYSGGSFSAINAVFIGTCFQDSSNCLGARSVDPFKAYSSLNGVRLERASASTVKVRDAGSTVSAYGALFALEPDNGLWSMSSDLDTGVTEAASTTYYLYISSQGDKLISDVAPYNRARDLGGCYHPFRPYRCLGSVHNNASSDFLSSASFERPVGLLQSGKFANAGCRTSVSGNALTVTLTTADGSDPSAINPVIVALRGVSASDGLSLQKRIEGPLTLTVPNTATLGTVNGLAAFLRFSVGWDGTRFLCSIMGGGFGPEIDAKQSVTYMTELGTGSDTAFLEYADIATATSCFLIPIAVIKITEASAGVWATDATSLYVNPRPYFGNVKKEVIGNGAANHGSTDTNIRRIGSDGTVTLSDDYGDIGTIVTNAANGTIFTAKRQGIYHIQYQDTRSGGTSSVGLSRNSSQLTTSYFSISSSDQLGGISAGAAVQPSVSVCLALAPDDKIRPHTSGNCDSNNCRFQVAFIAGT